MRRLVCGGVVLLIAVLASPYCVHAQDAQVDPVAASLLSMPFVPQSEVLCGGAALAMVLRHHGIRGVQAEDFAHLVVDSGEGILTTDLTEAAQGHGLDATPFTGTADVVRALLGAGDPVIALIEDRPGIYHYVVILAWGGGRVLFHDPAVGPHQVMTEAELMRAWAPAGYWALRTRRADTASDRGSAARSPLPGPGAVDACTAQLDAAAASAAANDLERAERQLNDAARVCTDATVVARERAGLRFRQQRYADAEAEALLRVTHMPDDTHAWELVAASRFLRADRGGALDAWNRIGRPHNDLTRISGLRRTPYGVVNDAVGIEPGDLVTSDALAHAGRRVAAIPSIGRARVDYQPVSTDTVQIDVAVVEHARSPFTPVDLALNAVRAGVNRSVLLQSANMLRLGERWRVEAVWQRNRRAFHAGVSVPAVLGMRPVTHVDAGVRDWAFAAPGTDALPQRETRSTASLGLSDWLTPRVRGSAGVGVEEWAGSATLASAGAGGAMHLAEDRVIVAGDVTGWWGADDDAVGRVRLNAEIGSSHDATDLVLLLHGALVSDAAPHALWSGAGTGRISRAFLRAHPLLDGDGIVRSHWWAPRLAAATLEVRHWLAAVGPLELGVAAFVDAAAASGAVAGAETGSPSYSRTAADGGFGLRVRVPGGPMVRLDAAHGIGNNASALSVGIGAHAF